jgi:hypothetical protein
MRRTAAAVIAIAIALVFSLPSLGFTSFQDAAHTIEIELQNRIAEIAGFPSPTPEETKESQGLEKALDAIGAYMEGTGKKDLGIVAKALGTTHGTGTQHSGLNAVCPEALDEFDGLALDEGDRAADVRSRIASPEGQAKVTAGIDKAEAIRLAARAEPAWGKAAKLFMKAQAGFLKAKETGLGILDKEVATTQEFTCSFPEVPEFEAEEENVDGGRSKDGVIHIYGRMPGSPEYVVTVAVDNPVGPGAYELMHGETWVRKRQGDTTWTWFRTSGTIEIEILTKRTAIGTFVFRAGNEFDVTNGHFRASLGKWVPPPGTD